MTAASGGTSDWQRRPRAFRPIATRDRGDPSRRRREHRGDRHPVLRAPVRRAPRAARRHLQPRQPGGADPADGPGRLGRRVRQLAGEDARAAARAPALAHRPQARLARHRPRAQYDVVHDNLFWAIVDVLGRRRHARGGGGVGRGLLADGVRPDQPGARPLQRPRRAARHGLARVGGGREDRGDRRRRHLPGAPHRRPAGADARCPASTSRCRCRCPTACGSPGSTA